MSTHGLRAEQIFHPSEPLFESTISGLLELLDGKYLERCGFITRDDQEIVPVENTHQDPHNNFYMSEEDASEALEYIYNETNREILGVWHTHPNGYPWPSPRDILGWPNVSLGWRYFLVSRGNVTEWRVTSDPTHSV